MVRKRVQVGLTVLLLSGAALGAGWQFRPRERLLSKCAVRVLDYSHEKEETRGYWLDAHTMLLVIGNPHTVNPHIGYWTPEDWTGKVQRLDIRTGQRTPDVGLTRMLNSLNAEPMDCEPAPGGQWLLWTVAVTPDHYPNPVVSTLDGKRHYNWNANKFGEKIWVNTFQWMHWWRDDYGDDPASTSGTGSANETEATLPTVYINDLRYPQKEQKLAINSPQVHALLSSLSPDGKEYVLEAKEASGAPVGWHLSVYDVVAYHLHSKTAPLRTLPLPFPFTPQYGDSMIAPDHRHILYHLQYEYFSPLLRWLHHLIPHISAPVEAREGLWVSDLNGSDLREIGHQVSTDQNAMQRVQWLSDNRQVRWQDENGEYVVSTE